MTFNAQINPSAILFCFTLLCCQASVASEQMQDEKSILSASGYLETYFLHDTNRPASEQRPSFAYSHTETDQASINLGFIKLKLDAEKVRGNLALGSGTYMRANYVVEPQALQKVLEANVGIKLANNLWLDAGVMPSHIGFESAIGLDNWTLSRSILADNSPYFETGVKLSYTSEDGKWYASGLLLNGWWMVGAMPFVMR